MKQATLLHTSFRLIVIIQFMLSLIFPAGALAARATQSLASSASPVEFMPAQGDALPSNPLAQTEDTTLQVRIISTPYVSYDSNSQPGKTQVFIVAAEVQNTGATTATGVSLTLNFDYPADAGWGLEDESNPSTRALGNLEPQGKKYAYWFAHYPTPGILSHVYQVTADAANAAPVSTTKNAFLDPADPKTVYAVSAISTGSTGITQVDFNVTVGVSFWVQITYALGQNVTAASFSPVGNLSFNAVAYRLLKSQIVLSTTKGGTIATIEDRAFFDQNDLVGLPAPDTALARFEFIAVKLATTTICPYAAIRYISTWKYDKSYCSTTAGTEVPIDGTISMELTKTANKTVLEQNDTIEYTITYNNTGGFALQSVWIWDVYNTGILTTTLVTPAPDLTETRDGLVAWKIGNVAAAGEPGSSGTLTVTLKADGTDLAQVVQDIPNGTVNLNTAYFGIDPGGLPSEPALSRTHTSTIQAPILTIAKTDELAEVTAGGTGTYSVSIANDGPVAAQNISLADTLPDNVTLGPGDPFPTPTSITGKTLTWSGFSLAAGDNATFTIPVTYSIRTPDAATVTNPAQVTWSNNFLHTFVPQSATDQTKVNNAVLTISKTAPAKVLTGNTLTYQLNYSNTGHGPASNVVITDVLPPLTTFVSCSPAPCGESGGTVTWTGLAVAAGASGSVSLTITVVGPFTTGSLLTNASYSINSTEFGPANGTPVSTVVENEAALFNVRAYADLNCDNVFTQGVDELLSGVPVTLTIGTTEIMRLTTSNGVISPAFRVEESVVVTISAGEMDGYFRSSPAALSYLANLGTETNIDFQYIPAAGACSVVFGVVYNDANHNAVQDPGEAGLEGVTVYSIPAAASGSVLTNQHGIYRLSYLTGGQVTIYEVNPAGFVSTTADEYPVTVTVPGTNASPYNFGDFAGVKVTGKVFNDANASGTEDGTEGGLAGATVSLEADSAVTGADGLFTLYAAVTPEQPLTLSEVNPTGYVSTNAIAGSGDVTVVDYDTMTIALPTAGTTYSSNKFADTLPAGVVTITGSVWEDNGPGAFLANGLRDPGEPGLAGVTVGLSSGMLTTTNSQGEFTLYAPALQTVTLYSVNKSGYVSTNAIPGSGLDTKTNNDLITLAPRAADTTVAGNLFGDVVSNAVAVISGTVFDDANENGVFAAPETGIAGVQVSLEVQGQPTIYVTTDSNGAYQFSLPPGVNARLTAAIPDGFYPTTPVNLVFTAPAAGQYPDNNFGFSNDSDTAVIFGVAFDDQNGNGVQDLGEPGLAGAEVTVAGVGTQTTSSNGVVLGSFSFLLPNAAAGTLYSVTEVPPTGYWHTTPGTILVVLTAGVWSYYVDFGNANNTNAGSIYGTVFDDLDEDGVQDTGEAGLPGVLVGLSQGGVALPPTVTGAYGEYSFSVTNGVYTVTSEDPAKTGYRSTTPDTVNIPVDLGVANAYVLNFGDTLIQANHASILGTVFNDMNVDGQQDAGEPGIPGVTVEVALGLTTLSAVTGPYGEYTIPVQTFGTYTVTETDPPAPFYSTTPNTVMVAVNASTAYVVNFGDANQAGLLAFFGTVYNDANVNGLFDNELGVAGVPLTLILEGALNPPYAAATSNEWGQYTFLIDTEGTFFIDSGSKLNYTSINANPGSAAVTRVDSDTLSTVVTGADFGQSLPDNQFGYAQNSNSVTVTGMVWEDQNGDAVKDAGEPGLAGAVVSVSSGLSQVTGADGLFSLIIPANTAVTLLEEDPTDHISTVAIAGSGNTSSGMNRINVSARAGGTTSAGNFFGDAHLTDSGVIKGFVYNDANGNFIKDGESGIPGVTVTLDGTTSTVTDSQGYYQFVVDNAGVYSVAETDLPNYFSTTPNLLVVQVAIGETKLVNFGDALNTSGFAVVYGVVFNDKNTNTTQDANELGVAGVTVTLDDALPGVTTSAYGAYGFKVAPAVTHKVRETDLPGYQSSTPNLVITAPLSNGASLRVNFGDFLPVDLCPLTTSDEFEPNDTDATAYVLTDFSQTYNLNFFDDATDWIKITAQARAAYTVTVTATGVRTDSVIALYQEVDGTLTLQKFNDDEQNTPNFSSKLAFTAPSSGNLVYFIKLSNRSGLKGCLTEYTLKIEEKPSPLKFLYLPLILKEPATQADAQPMEAPTGGMEAAQAPTVSQDILGINAPESPEGVIDHMCPDAYDAAPHDDTWETAQALALAEGDNLQLHSFDSNTNLNAADKDHIKFTLKFLDRVTITITPVDTTQTVVELFDASRSVLAAGTTTLSFTAQQAGEYYLIISPADTNTAFGCSDVAGYTINIHYSPTKWLYLPLIVK